MGPVNRGKKLSIAFVMLLQIVKHGSQETLPRDETLRQRNAEIDDVFPQKEAGNRFRGRSPDAPTFATGSRPVGADIIQALGDDRLGGRVKITFQRRKPNPFPGQSGASSEIGPPPTSDRVNKTVALADETEAIVNDETNKLDNNYKANVNMDEMKFFTETTTTEAHDRSSDSKTKDDTTSTENNSTLRHRSTRLPSNLRCFACETYAVSCSPTPRGQNIVPVLKKSPDDAAVGGGRGDEEGPGPEREWPESREEPKHKAEEYDLDGGDGVRTDLNLDHAHGDDSPFDWSTFNLSAEARLKEQKDLLTQVTDYGLQRLHEVDVKERRIFDAGIFLQKNTPGGYLAAFNFQSDELKTLARFGYAALQASHKLKDELMNSKMRQEILNITEDNTRKFPLISLIDTSLHDTCPLKNQPRCPTWNHLFRTIDGTCNNLRHPWWGAVFQPLKRFLAPDYSDGLEAVRLSSRGLPLPSPRKISTSVLWDKDVSSNSVTHLLMQWGQFIDHDITAASQSRGFNGSIPRCCDVPPHLLHPDCLPIEVPGNDPFYGRFGIRCLEFLRSAPTTRVGCLLGPREQVNQVTSYIDGSMIYGSTNREASKLRLFRNGMMRYTRMQQRLPLLPSDRNRNDFCRDANQDFGCFMSGDLRMNEQPGLLAIHTLFLRLHNRLTRQLAHLNPHWSDERLYQETRRIVGALIQHITYREFLPVVLGKDVMEIFDLKLLKEKYFGRYDEKVSAMASNSFAAAAFRFGHSMVQGRYLKWDPTRRQIFGNITLREELFEPGRIHRFGAVDELILGMCFQEAQRRDEHVTEELTNHLFETPSFPAGLDLASINIQRGRDHGLPSYNSWRNPCGLRRAITWEDLLHVMPEESMNNLRNVYRDVDDIDLFVGGLAEHPVRGGLVGSTFACIIAQHFRNLRRSDRFWYENGGFDSSFSLNQLQAIRRVTLARILCDNLDIIEGIQPFAFLTVDRIRNPIVSCRSNSIPTIDLSHWQELPTEKQNQKGNNASANHVNVPEMPIPDADPSSVGDLPKPMDEEAEGV